MLASHANHEGHSKAMADPALESGKIEKALEFLRSLGFSGDDTLIIGSASLFSLGYLELGRDGSPSDIDVLTTNTALLDGLKKRWENCAGKYTGAPGVRIKPPHEPGALSLEIYDRAPPDLPDMKTLFDHAVRGSGGFSYINPAHQIEFMRGIGGEKYNTRILRLMENGFS